MVLGAYHPLWVNLRSAGKLLVALAFVVDRAHRQYAGKLSLSEQADVIAPSQVLIPESQVVLEPRAVSIATLQPAADADSPASPRRRPR